MKHYFEVEFPIGSGGVMTYDRLGGFTFDQLNKKYYNQLESDLQIRYKVTVTLSRWYNGKANINKSIRLRCCF